MLGGCPILLTKSLCLDSIGRLTAYVCSCRGNGVCGLSEAGNFGFHYVCLGCILGKFVSISYLLISSSSKNVKVIKCSLPFLREEFLVLIHGVSSGVTDNNVGLDRRH
jgi:hypothetical protein